MLTVFLLSLGFVAAALLLLSVRVLLVKGGTFKSQHIHDNEYLRQRGIDCVLEQDRQAQRKI